MIKKKANATRSPELSEEVVGSRPSRRVPLSDWPLMKEQF